MLYKAENKSQKYKNNVFGKNVIDGDKVFFSCPEKPMTRENINLELEYHKRYIDIHIVLEGEESIVYTSLENCKETVSYDAEKDFTLLKGNVDLDFYLNNKKFLILFPYEPHIALLKVNEAKEIKKVVFKVEIE